VLRALGSTGVLEAVSAAVALRAPTLAFPVGDLDSLAPIAWGAGAAPAPLRDCVVLKPGSTVDDVFQALKRPPNARLAGEFVRAEGMGAARERRRQLRKDDVVSFENESCILRIMTNRKSQWQPSRQRAGAS